MNFLAILILLYRVFNEPAANWNEIDIFSKTFLNLLRTLKAASTPALNYNISKGVLSLDRPTSLLLILTKNSLK